MITINDEYKKNINNMFGEIGDKWLDSIPDLVSKYIKKFGLANIRVNEPLTYNIIIFADSIQYGPVILKIEIPFKEMTIRESVALELNNGVGACKCYFKDIEDGVLLIEKLNPGESLNTINDLEERTRIFVDVLNRFSIDVHDNNDLPLYKDILKRSVDMVNNDQSGKFDELKESINIADSLYMEIDNKGFNHNLLHSDLSCGNIVKSGNDWKSIDPHGFVGNKVIDTAIFIQKELDKIGYNKENIDSIISLVSEYSLYSKEEIANIFYVNYVLNICWDKEVNLDISNSLVKSKIILDYINSLEKPKTKSLLK